jgi:hypothetical protein
LPARNEAKLVAKIVKYLNSLEKCFAWKAHGGPMQARGVSDIQVCYWGNYHVIEVKDPNNPKGPTPYQELFMDKIKRAGGEAYVVRSLAEVKEIFK